MSLIASSGHNPFLQARLTPAPVPAPARMPARGNRHQRIWQLKSLLFLVLVGLIVWGSLNPSLIRKPQPRIDSVPAVPLAHAWISSPYGMRNGRPHQGIDYAAPGGSPIRAAEAGRVVFAGWVGGYGRLVVIEHRDQVRTRYAHCSRILVKPGQTVSREQTIALVGSTGRSTGPHLHFEVMRQGKHINPQAWLNPQAYLATSRR